MLGPGFIVYAHFYLKNIKITVMIPIAPTVTLNVKSFKLANFFSCQEQYLYA